MQDDPKPFGKLFNLYQNEGLFSSKTKIEDAEKAFEKPEARKKLFDLGKKKGLFNTTKYDDFEKAFAPTTNVESGDKSLGIPSVIPEDAVKDRVAQSRSAAVKALEEVEMSADPIKPESPEDKGAGPIDIPEDDVKSGQLTPTETDRGPQPYEWASEDYKESPSDILDGKVATPEEPGVIGDLDAPEYKEPRERWEKIKAKTDEKSAKIDELAEIEDRDTAISEKIDLYRDAESKVDEIDNLLLNEEDSMDDIQKETLQRTRNEYKKISDKAYDGELIEKQLNTARSRREELAQKYGADLGPEGRDFDYPVDPTEWSEEDRNEFSELQWEQQNLEMLDQGLLGEVRRGLGGGAMAVGSMAGGVVNFLGDVVGSEGMEKMGIDMIEDYSEKMQEVSGEGTTSVEQILTNPNKLSNFAKYVAYNLGQGFATSAPMMIPGFGLISMAGMAIGDVRQSQVKEMQGGDPDKAVDPSAINTAAWAIPYFLADKFGLGGKYLRAMRGAAGRNVKQKAVGRGAKEFAKGFGRNLKDGIKKESKAEGLQEVYNVGAGDVEMSRVPFFNENIVENLKAYGEGAAGGAVGGMGMASATAYAETSAQQEGPAKNKMEVEAPDESAKFRVTGNPKGHEEIESLQQGNTPKQLIHYSKKKGLQELDPSFEGTGTSNETNQGDTETPVTYFYLPNTKAERAVTTSAKSKYVVTPEEDLNLYDMSKDPDGIVAGATEESGAAMDREANLKAVREAGYDGYYSSGSRLPNAVALFNAQKVASENEVTLEERKANEATFDEEMLDPSNEQNEHVKVREGAYGISDGFLVEENKEEGTATVRNDAGLEKEVPLDNVWRRDDTGQFRSPKGKADEQKNKPQFKLRGNMSKPVAEQMETAVPSDKDIEDRLRKNRKRYKDVDDELSKLEDVKSPEERNKVYNKAQEELSKAPGAPQNNFVELENEKGQKWAVGPVPFDKWVEKTESILDKGEVKEFRQWYSKARNIFKNEFGQDWEKAMLGWLMGNQNTSPAGGLLNAIREREKALGLKSDKLGGLNADNLSKLFKGQNIEGGIGPKLFDFIDSTFGSKTRSYLKDSEEAGGPAVIDLQTGRDIGLADNKTLKELEKVFGKDQVAKIKKDWNGAPSETQYEYGSKYLNMLTNYLNDNNIDGGNWSVEEAQAVGWMSTAKLLNGSMETPQAAIDKNKYNINFELAFGKDTEYSKKYSGFEELDNDGKTKATAIVAQKLSDYIDSLGIFASGPTMQKGAWMDAINPSTSAGIIASPEAAELASNVAGYLLQQEGVLTSRPSSKQDADPGIRIASETLSDPKAVEELWAAIREAFPDFIGATIVEEDGVTSMKILDLIGDTYVDKRGTERPVTKNNKRTVVKRRLESYENGVFEELAQVVADVIGDADIKSIQEETIFSGNEWKNDRQKGNSYLRRISELRGPEFAKRLENDIRKEFESEIEATLQAAEEGRLDKRLQEVGESSDNRSGVNIQESAEGVRFSLRSDETGPAMDRSVLEILVKKFMRVFKVDVVVAKSESELPTKLQGEIDEAGVSGGFNAVYDPSTGKIFLMADNIPSKVFAIKLLAHEAFHAGWSSKGVSESRRVLNKIYKEVEGRKDGDPTKELLKEIIADYDYDMTKPKDRLKAAEELMAHMGEENWMTKDTTLWDVIVKEVKRVIAKITNDQEVLNEISDQDIVDIIKNVRYDVYKKGSGGLTSDGVRFDIKGGLHRAAKLAFRNGDTLAEFIDANPDYSTKEMLQVWARMQRALGKEARDNFEDGQDPKGEPELANIVEDEEAQRAINNVDELRTKAARSDKEVFEQAEQRLEEDYEGAKQELFDLTAEPSLSNWTDVEVRMATMIIEREGTEALKTGDKEQMVELMSLVDTNRRHRTAAGRAFRQMRDSFMSNKEKAGEFVEKGLGAIDAIITNREAANALSEEFDRIHNRGVGTTLQDKKVDKAVNKAAEEVAQLKEENKDLNKENETLREDRAYAESESSWQRSQRYDAERRMENAQERANELEAQLESTEDKAVSEKLEAQLEEARTELSEAKAQQQEATQAKKPAKKKEPTSEEKAKQESKERIKSEIETARDTIKKIVAEHYTDASRAYHRLEDALMFELNLSEDQAIKLKQAVNKKFNKVVSKEKKKALNNRLGKTVSKIQKKPLFKQLIELSNLGAMETEKFRAAMADKMGLPHITDPVAARLREAMDKIQTSTGQEKNKAIIDLFDTISREKIVGGAITESYKMQVDQLLESRKEIEQAEESVTSSYEQRVVGKLMNAMMLPPREIRNKLQDLSPEERAEFYEKYIDKFEEVKETLKGQNIDLENLTTADLKDPNKMRAIVRTFQAANSAWHDQAYEYFINALLSAAGTYVVNVVGNTTNIIINLTAQRAAEALLNQVAKNKSNASFGEIKYVYKALFASVPKAWQMASTAWNTETGMFAEELGVEDRDLKFTEHSERGVAIGGTKGRVIRTPVRLLQATDEFTKVMAWHAEMAAEAHRMGKDQGLKGDDMTNYIARQLDQPEGEAAKRAWQFALEQTYQEETGQITKWFLDGRRSASGLRYFLPFVTTPANLLKQGLRKSPLGILNMMYRGTRHASFKLTNKSGGMRYEASKVTKDTAEQLVAWGGLIFLSSLISDGDDEDDRPFITGAGDGYRQKGRHRFQGQNIPPQSILIDGTYYSYQRVEPLSTILSQSVDFLNMISDMRKGQDPSEALMTFVERQARVITDKSYLKGLGDMARIFFEGDVAHIGTWAADFSTAWMPNIIKSVGRAEDDYVRESVNTSEGTWGQIKFLGDKVKSRGLPFSATQRKPRVDWLGRDVKKKEGVSPATDFVYRLLSPSRAISLDPQTQYDRMILNWNNQNPSEEKQWYPNSISQSVTMFGESFTLTDEEYYKMAKIRGQYTAKILDQLAENGAFDFDNPSEMHMEMIDDAYKEAYQYAKVEMFNNGGFERQPDPNKPR